MGGQKASWGISEYGHVEHKGKKCHSNLKGVKVGEIAVLTLDLSGNGTLTWCVQGGETQTAFSNLREHLAVYPGGFVPAVSTSKPSRVCLVGFQKLQD